MSTSPTSPSNGARQVLVVLGMHRSGTSAVTGALCELGFPVGGPALPAAADNPLGYFENADAVDINEALLLDLGRGWDDLRGLPDGWQASDAAEDARQRIGVWLDRVDAPAGRLILKDPRLCLVFPVWREVLESRGIDLRVVLAHRALPEIVASLVKRDGLAERNALLLTLAHLLAAEFGSRGLVRSACHYSALLDNPAEAIERLISELEIGPMAEEAIARALSKFDPGQRHHRHEGRPLGCEGLEDICDAVAWTGRVRGTVSALDDRFAIRVANACREGAATMQPRADALSEARRSARRFAIEARKLDAALADATALATSRLDDIRVLTAELANAHHALERTEALALERLEAMAALDTSLRETREALARIEALAIERMLRSASLETECDALKAARDSLEARVELLDGQLAAMLASWAWRITAPWRWLAFRLSGGAP